MGIAHGKGPTVNQKLQASIDTCLCRIVGDVGREKIPYDEPSRCMGLLLVRRRKTEAAVGRPHFKKAQRIHCWLCRPMVPPQCRQRVRRVEENVDFTFLWTGNESVGPDVVDALYSVQKILATIHVNTYTSAVERSCAVVLNGLCAQLFGAAPEASIELLLTLICKWEECQVFLT